MKMMKIVGVLSVVSVMGLIGCGKSVADAAKECQACKGDAKCIEGVQKKFPLDQLKGSEDDAKKYGECIASGMLAGMGKAMEEAAKEIGKAAHSGAHATDSAH